VRKWTEPEEEGGQHHLPGHPVAPLLFALLFLGAALLAFTLTRSGEPVLTVEAWIVDAETGQPLKADVFLDGERVFQGVERFRVEVPSGTELRVVAEGYHPWALRFRYELREGQVLRGPVRLLQKKGNREQKDSPPRE